MKPDDEGGSYKQAISVLYRVAYTLKMSYKSDHRMEGFFEYVVPPLEEMDEYLEQNGYCKTINFFSLSYCYSRIIIRVWVNSNLNPKR